MIPTNTIQVVYHSDASRPIAQAHAGEWCDLRTAEDVELEAGEYKAISLGVSIKLPEGYEALVAPRGSSFKNYGVLQVNPPGVVDELFCGNKDIWHWLVYATRNANIPAGTRVAQFRIIETQGELNIEEVESLGDINRGGFGSTGKA